MKCLLPLSFNFSSQLLAVKGADGNDVERYAYDKAGNMVRKSLLKPGRAVSTKPPTSEDYTITTFTFDGANQLVSSTTDGVTTRYAYDAAGRMVREGNKTYAYGYLDKVMSVTEGDRTYTYTYHADGQLASANYGGKTEGFLWDGLALVRRGDEQFINEPHVGGGNPVASSKGTSYFNDMLGTTVGSKSNGKYSAAALSAFGERLDNVDSTSPAIRSLGEGWFTGKPFVEGLGRTFLMRNYRASLAKWQTADPLGYPDGWNQLAYCGNGVINASDLFGAVKIVCQDMNTADDSGYNKKEITSASQLEVKRSSNGTNEGGYFYVGYDFATGYGGEITVYLDLEIVIDSAMKKDCDFKYPDESRYAPHTGEHDNSMARNPVFEAIKEHELAHAKYFFDTQLRAISDYLIKHNIDGMGSIMGVQNLVVDALDYAFGAEFMKQSNSLANQAVYDWFDVHRDKWERITDLGDFRRWRVKE